VQSSQAASRYCLSTYRGSGIRGEGSGPNRHVARTARVERLGTVLIRRATCGPWVPVEYMYRPLFGHNTQRTQPMSGNNRTKKTRSYS
jgi:hypothetical protein